MYIYLVRYIFSIYVICNIDNDMKVYTAVRSRVNPRAATTGVAETDEDDVRERDAAPGWPAQGWG
jgi:hypothetical protein